MSEKVEMRRNCFNTIRLLGAFDVMYGHIIEHLNIQFPVLKIFGGVNTGSIFNYIFSLIPGVPIFFFLSGFLVWDSVKRSSTLREYACKRFLRIYPELWIGVVVELIPIIVFYLPHIVWTDFALFAFGQATIFQFWTPDSLRGYGYGTPNGSLWTICVIIQFYCVIWFIRKVVWHKSLLFHICILVISVAVSAGTHMMEGHIPEIIFKLYRQTVIPYFWLFYLGVSISEMREQIVPFLKKHWYLFAIGLVVKSVVDIDIPTFYPLIHCLLLCGLVVSVGYAFPKMNIKTDISYGLYIYHMIVVNVFIELGFVGSVWYMLAVMLLSVLLAGMSTVFVERLIKRRKEIQHG